ncbi:DEAD/DEAH box helicase [Microbacterium rhizophilus]|uniref:DEAD/DEAH box helicase n=1 Tax=Microbacterium rhizophilus TaxID=3138934 RepID=UPI0031F18955
MPKNKKPAGGRPAQNFDPRYAKKKTGGPFRGSDGGSRGPRRDDSAGRFDRAERPRVDRDARPARDGERRSFDRPQRDGERRFDRPNRDGERRFERPNRDGERRFERSDRPRAERPHTERSDRPARSWESRDGERRGADRGDRRSFDRPARDGERRSFDRPARDGERRSFDRPQRDGERRFERTDRPRFDRTERPRFDRAERPRFDRAERPARDERPRFDRAERPARDERPRFDRAERPARDERPRFDRAERPARDERPRFDRAERPARDERPRFQNDGERKWAERRDERPARSQAQEDRIDVVHERLEAQAVQADEVAAVTFADLGFGDNIVRALAALGAEKPFPIQASTAPSIIDGRDVLARGRTGSGKTIAFGAPLVERILRSKAGEKREFGRAPVALIMAPTRELALQIDRTVQAIARSVGLFTTQIYGGVPQGRQVGALKKGVDIVIGTPGRIGDLHRQGKLDLSRIQVSVLDEADHMCELGFLEPVQEILRQTADGGQKLLFSATLDREVAALVDEFLVDPQVYEVAGETQETGTIEHRVLVVEHRSKPEILDQLVAREGKTLVFTRTRAYAEMLAEQFDGAGIDAISLHGDLNQAKRTRNIERFSKGRARVLVATDVAARGIHVDDVDLVIQADAPDEYKTYLHRAGRTGRAGNSGRVVTLIPRQRRRRMTEMLERAEIQAPFDEVRPGDDVLDELAGGPTVAELTA